MLFIIIKTANFILTIDISFQGFYELANMTLDTSQFPNVFPFEKGGADIDIELTDTRERLFTIVYHATFSQKKKH